MYGRASLGRFKKAQISEPFSVTLDSASRNNSHHQSSNKADQQPILVPYSQSPTSIAKTQSPVPQNHVGVGVEAAPFVGPAQQGMQVGGSQSTWQPPDWAIEPRPGVYYLEVLKDGEVLDQISLDKKRHIFGRQFHTCDFVLDHQSVSRQHAAVIPHKNGSIYVVDLGSAHGTFVANERLTKDSPTELEIGQSLRFAASTRTYILRKNNAALFPRPPSLKEINLPPAPDPSDEEAVVSYNTLINRFGLNKSDLLSNSNIPGDQNQKSERPSKRIKKMRVAFRDQVGGDLFEVVGISDGVDVDRQPGLVGVKEGSLVGKYESLVQTTVIPKGKGLSSFMEENSVSRKGVTDKLQEVLNNVKTPAKGGGGIYDDLYGYSLPGKLGSSWAKPASPSDYGGKESSGKSDNSSVTIENDNGDRDDDDDLFGD